MYVVHMYVYMYMDVYVCICICIVCVCVEAVPMPSGEYTNKCIAHTAFCLQDQRLVLHGAIVLPECLGGPHAQVQHACCAQCLASGACGPHVSPGGWVQHHRVRCGATQSAADGTHLRVRKCEGLKKVASVLQ